MKLLLINGDGLLKGCAPPVSRKLPPSAVNGDLEELKSKGVRIVALTSGNSKGLKKYMEHLGIDSLYQGIPDISEFYTKLKQEHHVNDSEVAFLGGERGDVLIMDSVIFSSVPHDTELDVKAKTYYVACGKGEDSLSEVARVLLAAKTQGE
ncbi:MAG: hypothetical protein V3U74_01500 [Thermodesulfobacteriota bacterium]